MLNEKSGQCSTSKQANTDGSVGGASGGEPDPDDEDERARRSKEQMQQLEAGEGKSIAGANKPKVPIKDVNRLVAQYGGKAGDWQKVASRTKGAQQQIHAYRNVRTGQVVEMKTTLPNNYFGGAQ